METASVFIRDVPLIVPGAGMGLAVILYGLGLLGLYLLLLGTYAPLREGGGSDSGDTVILVYVPALGQLASVVGLIKEAWQELLKLLDSLMSPEIIRLVIASIGLVLSILIIQYHDVVQQSVYELDMCYLYNIRALLFELVNAARFLGSMVVFPWNLYWNLSGSVLLVLRRTITTCAVENGPALVSNVIEHVGDALRELLTALGAFLSSPTIIDDRIDMLPFMANVGLVVSDFSAIFDCVCDYFSFIWTGVLQLPSQLTLHYTVDYAVNAAVRLIQAVFIMLRDQEVLQLSRVIVELQGLVLSAGDFVEDVIEFLITTLIDLVNLIPVSLSVAATTPTISATLQTVASPAFTAASGAFNLSDVLGLQYLVRIGEAPWSRVATEPAAGALALVNNTWSLTLLITRGCLCIDDVQYFQMGYIFDHVANGGYALGKVAATFDDKLYLPVADLVVIAAKAVQIAIEVFIKGVFANVYTPSPDNNPFAYLVDYCNATTEVTTPRENYRVLYNHSAAIAELLGCDPLLEPFPLTTKRATCLPQAPIAGLVMGIYRLLAEIVDFLLKLVCYGSELIQFDPDVTTFKDISFDSIFWELKIVADAIKRLLYELDVIGFGDPPSATCEFFNVDGSIDFKISFQCTIANILELSLLAVGGFAFEVAYLFKYLFASFPMPNLVTSVRIPALRDTLADLDAALCQAGALVGSIFPYSFGCGSGTNSRIGRNYVQLDLFQVGDRPPVVNVSRQVNHFCTLSGADWAGNESVVCNCTALGTLEWTSLATMQHPCALECLLPSILPGEFPLQFGLAGLPVQCYGDLSSLPGTAMAFTNMTTFRRFLSTPDPFGGLFNPPTPPLGQIYYDANASVVPAYELFRTIAIAKLNKRANEIFRPATSHYATVPGFICPYPAILDAFVVSVAPGDPVITDAWIGFRNEVGGMDIRDIIAAQEYIGAGLIGNVIFSETLVFLINDCVFANATRVHTAMKHVANLSVAQPAALYLLDWYLQHYNAAYTSCNSAISTSPCIQSSTPGDPITPPNAFPPPRYFNTSDNSTGSANQICTYNLIDYIPINSTGAGCDCSQPQYNRNASCLLACDPPALPVMYGHRSLDCFFPSCGYTERTIAWTNLASYQAFISNLTALPANYTDLGHLGYALMDMTSTLQTPFPASLMREFVAASLNLYYMQRYRPDRTLYFRSMEDPLYTSTKCMSRFDERQIYAGQRIDVVLNVINQTLIGNYFSRRCSLFFKFAEPEYRFCKSFWSLYNQTAVGDGTDIFSLTPNPQHAADLENYIVPVLRLINTFRPGCDDAFDDGVGHECIVVSSQRTDRLGYGVPFAVDPDDVDLPPLDFRGPQVARLVDYDPRNMEQCKSTQTCVQGVTCTLSRAVLLVFTLTSGIIDQINLAIQNGSGTWTLGTGFWQLLKSVLGDIVERLSANLLADLGLLDCIACAIDGNYPDREICQGPMFNFFKPLVRAILKVVTAVVNFAVDILKFVVLFVAYLFSGQWYKLIETLIQFFVELWNDLIYPLLLAVLELIVGSICLCPAWNTLFGKDTFKCDNNAYCGFGTDASQYKRSILDAPIQHTYQYFAADWPASGGYSWPAAHPCGTRMASLEAAALAGTLTRMEAYEAAYCLAGLVLWPGIFAPATTTASSSTVAINTCNVTMEFAGAMALSYHDLGAELQIATLKCIDARATATYARAVALNGSLDWLPDDVLSGDVSVLRVGIPLAYNFMQAMTAVRERDRDAVMTPVDLTSPEKQATLTAAYFGTTARADLATRTASAAEPPPIEEYVDAVLGTSTPAVQKRQVVGGDGGAKVYVEPNSTGVVRTKAMARAILQIRERLGVVNVTQVVVDAIDRQLASMPVLYDVVQEQDERGYTTTRDTLTTQRLFEEEYQRSLDIQTETTLNADLRKTLLRVAHGGFRIITQTYRVVNAFSEATAATEQLAVNKKRIAGGSTGMRLVNVFATGLGGLWRLGLDVLSGRAYANATAAVYGTASVATAVPWELASGSGAARAARIATASQSDPGYAEWAAELAQRPTGFWDRMAKTKALTRIAATFSARLQGLASLRHSLALATPSVRTQKLRQLGQLWANFAPMAPSNFDAAGIRIYRGANVTIDPALCLSDNADLCQQCFIVDQFYGFYLQQAELSLDFYMSTSPQPVQRLNYVVADYTATRDYLLDRSIPVRVGNSALNPVRFPSYNTPSVNYIDDPIPYKIGFSDAQPLIDQTMAFVNDILGQTNLFDATPVYQGVSLGNNGTAPRRFPASGLPAPTSLNMDSFSEWALAQPSPLLRAVGQLTMAPAGGGKTMGISTTAGSFFTVFVDWLTFINKLLLRCDRYDEFSGMSIRFSIGQAILFNVIIVVVLIAISIYSPTASSYIISFTGVSLAVLVLSIILSLSLNWSLSCAPAIPPALVTKAGIHFLTEVAWPKCPVWGAGLVLQADYNNSNCNSCSNWENYFTIGHCRRDFGWSNPLDAPVFLLLQLQPDWLTALRTPSNFPFPLSAFIGSSFVQQWLGRWDAVDFASDPILYSGHWTCSAIFLIFTIAALFFAIVLLKFAPIFATAKLLLLVADFILRCAPYFVFAAGYLLYAMLIIAPRMINRRIAKLRHFRKLLDM